MNLPVWYVPNNTLRFSGLSSVVLPWTWPSDSGETMKLSLYTNDLLEAPVDLLAVGVFSDEPDRGIAFSNLNRTLSGALDRACRDEQFEGHLGQVVVFNVAEGLKTHRIVVFGYPFLGPVK